VSKFSLDQRSVEEDCRNCNLCIQDCPVDTIDPDNNFESDPGECTVCMQCLVTCPRGSTKFKLHVSKSGLLKRPAWSDYDPDRRKALLAMGSALAAVALFRVERNARANESYLIRPPGSLESDMQEKCIRCAVCLRACPTGALQPATRQAGLEGLWSPVLVPRLGYCDYACNACGQLCPVDAIPPLSLTEKREQILGKAYIDQNRCIAWSDFTDCIVCEEMCPIADKAIFLEDTQFETYTGDRVMVKVPQVIRERCIGCGICEFKCPVSGEAAIRIFTHQAA